MCVDVCVCARVLWFSCFVFFLFCFVLFFTWMGWGRGEKGKGIAEMTVSHTASNKIHGKILHLWKKCLLEKHVLLLFSCC